MNDYFRSNPTWGATGPSPLIGVGPTGPNYDDPRDPQPGEAPELLPAFAGSEAEVSKVNERRLSRKTPRVERFSPYLTYPAFIPFNTTFDNQVEIGRPNKGYHWIVREFVFCSPISLVDATWQNGGMFTGGFFVGASQLRHPGGATTFSPTMTDFVWGIEQAAGAANPQSFFTQTFGSDQIIVQDTQTLYCRIEVASSTVPTVAIARVQQFSNVQVMNVEEV